MLQAAQAPATYLAGMTHEQLLKAARITIAQWLSRWQPPPAKPH
jgi:hypothetical protein